MSLRRVREWGGSRLEPAARRRLGGAAGITVSAVSLAAVVWWASRQDAPEFPTSPGSLAYLVAALLVYVGATILRGWRWSHILQTAGIEHRRTDAYALVAVGYMGNTVLPARGGELLRIVLLAGRTEARRREVLGTILAERILDAVVLALLFALVTWLGVAGAPAGTEPAIAAVALLAVAAAALAIYLRLRRAGRMERFAAMIRPVARASRLLMNGVGGVLAGVTAAVWFLEALVFVLVAASLGIDLSVLEALFVNLLASFFALVPAGPGYVGTFDAALLFGLAALGVRGGDAVAFALLSRFVLFVPITVAGLVLVITRYGGLERVIRPLARGGSVAS